MSVSFRENKINLLKLNYKKLGKKLFGKNM